MQNNDDYITISEFTRSAGISPAAVYKRINNLDAELLTYVKTVNKQKYIRKDAIMLFKLPNKQPINNQINDANNVNNAEINNKLIAIYEENLTILRTDAENKNEQIARKDAQIAEDLAMLKAELESKNQQIAEKDAQIARKDVQIAEKDAQITALNAHLENQTLRVQESLYVAAAAGQKTEQIEQETPPPAAPKQKTGFWGWVKKHLD